MINLNNLKHVHFVGIGGVGTSAIARMMLGRGITISGSDRSASPVTASLIAAGAKIHVGASMGTIPNQTDLVVYTVAIPPENSELVEARRRGVPLATYPEMLEIVSAEKYTVAVSGTHGKTTTTAMLGSILIEAGLDPTVLVGGLMIDPRREGGCERGNEGGRKRESGTGYDFENHGTNFILGESKYFVVEADEYRKSFHHLAPQLLVITNIDADHLDFYKNLADVQAAFAELARRVPAQGFIVCDPHDPQVAPVIAGVAATIIDYRRQLIPPLLASGEHNRADARAAGAAAKALNVDDGTIAKALGHFPGTWRRFQYRGKTTVGALVYDDYAHNPQKVAAAIAGAREQYPTRQIFAVFQPHLYSRTKFLFNDFIGALAEADRVLLLPIYAAREVDDLSISSAMLGAALAAAAPASHPIVCEDFIEAKKYLDRTLVVDDVVVVMGAGDSTQFARLLVQ